MKSVIYIVDYKIRQLSEKHISKQVEDDAVWLVEEQVMTETCFETREGIKKAMQETVNTS